MFKHLNVIFPFYNTKPGYFIIGNRLLVVPVVTASDVVSSFVYSQQTVLSARSSVRVPGSVS